MNMQLPNCQPLRITLYVVEEVVELLPDFVGDLPTKVSQLAVMLDRADLHSLRQAAHQLKGVGGAFGFMPLTTAAENLETAIAAGHSIDDISILGLRLKDLIRAIDGYDAS